MAALGKAAIRSEVSAVHDTDGTACAIGRRVDSQGATGGITCGQGAAIVEINVAVGTGRAQLNRVWAATARVDIDADKRCVRSGR